MKELQPLNEHVLLDITDEKEEQKKYMRPIKRYGKRRY